MSCWRILISALPVYNINATSGKKTLTLGSQGGSSSVTDVLTSIFGSNGAYGLVSIDVAASDIDVRFKLSANTVPVSLAMKVCGWISTTPFGMGRGGTDRQYLHKPAAGKPQTVCQGDQ